MMYATLSIGAILLVASHLSCAIILRPRWYPYFPRQSQVARGSVGGSDFAALRADTMESRQVRMAGSQEVPVCDVRLTSRECLNQLVVLIGRLLESRSRRHYL